MRIVMLPLLALLAPDIGFNPGGMNPRAARVTHRYALPGAGAITNWDLSADGSVIGMTEGHDKVVFLDARTGKKLAEIHRQGMAIHDTGIGGDGKHYALTLNDGTIEIYSSEEGKKVSEFRVSSGFC